MLFGEKYEDVVRMIQFDTSKELCGGTHVNATGEIGLFKILSERSISSGIRRIEAKTGENALRYLIEQEVLLNEIRGLVKNKDVKTGIEQLVYSNKQLDRQLANLKDKNISSVKDDLIASAVKISQVRFIAKEVQMNAEDMKSVSFKLRKEENLAMILAAKSADKALLSVMLTDDLIAQGMDAVVIIRQLAKEINGGGGGQAFFATAGGSYLEGIQNALNKAQELIG